MKYKYGTKEYVWWPIGFAFPKKKSFEYELQKYRTRFFSWHGWEIGHRGLEHHVFGWTLHIGRFKIFFGKGKVIKDSKSDIILLSNSN